MRPDSPLKLFTGQVASRDTFAADLEFMAFYDFPPNSPVIVSSPKTVIAEWRFVVVRGNVVAGSQYKQGDELVHLPNRDNVALDLAKEIAAMDYQPDPVWILDVCQTDDGGYHLLEIGGFSFADLYACNKRDLVEAVSQAAIDVWKKS